MVANKVLRKVPAVLTLFACACTEEPSSDSKTDAATTNVTADAGKTDVSSGTRDDVTTTSNGPASVFDAGGTVTAVDAASELDAARIQDAASNDDASPSSGTEGAPDGSSSLPTSDAQTWNDAGDAGLQACSNLVAGDIVLALEEVRSEPPAPRGGEISDGVYDIVTATAYIALEAEPSEVEACRARVEAVYPDRRRTTARIERQQDGSLRFDAANEWVDLDAQSTTTSFYYVDEQAHQLHFANDLPYCSYYEEEGSVTHQTDFPFTIDPPPAEFPLLGYTFEDNVLTNVAWYMSASSSGSAASLLCYGTETYRLRE